MLKIIMRSVCILLLGASLISCGKEDVQATGYQYSYAEIAFDLPSDYIKIENETFDAFYTNRTAFVGISRLSFYAVNSDDLDGSMFPETVAEKYAQKNSMDVDIIISEFYSYFTYNDSGYFNLFAFYRSKYAHFIVRFMCPEDNEHTYKSEFIRCASSAIFTQ